MTVSKDKYNWIDFDNYVRLITSKSDKIAMHKNFAAIEKYNNALVYDLENIIKR